MKPKRNHFRTLAFPALIIIPAMAVSFAATILPDSAGNISVPAGTNAAGTILASGGSSPTPIVTIGAGAVLTGDAALQTGAEVSAAGYTINNSGTLRVTAEGILVDAAAVSGIVINNNTPGLIEGGDDGIYLDGDGGTINNSGTIRGITGVNSDGIEGFGGLTVNNSGSISGAAGIFAESTLSVLNESGANITASTEAGVDATDDAFIDNFGTISSTGGEGILVFDRATIFNGTSIDGLGNAISGGLIRGATNGIFTGADLQLVNENLGVIAGMNGVGVDAGDGAQIFNEAGAQISGSFGGISVGATGFVQNDGLIDGMGGDGVTLGAGGEIFNAGTISGTTGIVAFDGSLITNSGLIRSTAIGGNAFSGGVGNDDLALEAGSLILGNVLGGGGTNSIAFNGGLSSPTSPENTIRGSVTDFASITKAGGGVALIGAVADVGGGLNITADTISITGGGLYFNADINGATVPQATINAGGAAVGGTGIWNANLNLLSGGISAGAIPINLDAIPENSVGAVAITGDVVHSLGSFIRLDIVPDTPIIDGINSDIIEQIGAGNTYNVSGGNLRIASTDVNRLITPGTYTVIDSDEAILGLAGFGTIGVQFNPNIADTGPFTATGSGANYLDSVLTNFFVTPGLEDGGTNLVLGIGYDFAGLPGLSGSAQAFAGALDALALQAGTGTLDPNSQDFLMALAFSDLASVQGSLAALQPESNLQLAAGIMNSNYRLHRQIQNHLAASRSSGEMMTVETSPAMTGPKGGMIPAQTETRSSGGRGSFWGSVSYDEQDYEGTNPADDFEGDATAITAGYDYRVSSSFLIGGMIDGSRSDYDEIGGSTEIDSLRFAVYGTYGQSLGFYSDFLLGYGTHDWDQSRSVGGIPGFAGLRFSATDADSFQAMLTFGYAMGDERVKHGPFAGLEYQMLDVDGFDDSGAVIDIAVDDFDIDSLRGLVGYRVDANFGTFRPYASIAYAHEFEDGPTQATASIAGSEFRVRGPELESAILLGVGTGIAFNPNLSLDIGYRGEISVESEGLDSHGASLGLKYNF